MCRVGQACVRCTQVSRVMIDGGVGYSSAIDFTQKSHFLLLNSEKLKKIQFLLVFEQFFFNVSNLQMVDRVRPGLVLCQLTGVSHSPTKGMGRPQKTIE